MERTPLIDIRDLSVGFTGRSGATLAVLRNVDLAVRAGETLGLVGESGSGKSTLALAAMGYLKRGLRVLGGESSFAGQSLFALPRPALERLRGGRIALIPQNSGQSLTPTLRIGEQLLEALRLHTAPGRARHRARALELLARVRLPEPEALFGRFPHELSGGQQQRVAISMALAGEPEALLLDEPTTGLDVTTQAHVLTLLRELAAETGTAMVYVSHDLGAIAQVCDRVAVMYAGEVVLEGSIRQVLDDPLHPYARALLASLPRLRDAGLPRALDGRPPALEDIGERCAFVERCTLAAPRCRAERPQLEPLPGGEAVRCFRHAEVRALPIATARTAAERRLDTAPTALSIIGLSVSYARPGLLRQLGQRVGRYRPPPPTVEDVSIELLRGETLALVGESGSGKSTILKTVAGLLPPLGGQVSLPDEGALPARVEQRSAVQRQRIQIVFQNPDESLNPRQTIGEILAQPLTLYFGLRGAARTDRAVALLERVRLGAHHLGRFPAQLSGGEKQRVAIARAFAAAPELVLCDEVTSALDVSVQAAVLDLLDELRRERDTAYLFVSHDLAVVRALADRVAVLYQGRLCELGPAAAVYAGPSHPYTAVLLDAVLDPDPDVRPRLPANDVPERAPDGQGCPFRRRCPRRLGALCDEVRPPWQSGADGHRIRCHIPLFETVERTC